MATARTSTDPTPEGSEEMESEDVGKTLMGQLTAAMLQGTKDQLQTNLWNQDAVLEAAKLPLPEEDDEEVLRSNLQELQRELHSVVTDLAQKELVMRRLQLSHTLMETLYPAKGVSAEGDATQREELKELVLQQCDLVSKILEEYKEMQEMRPKLEDALNKKFATSIMVGEKRAEHGEKPRPSADLTRENRRLMSVLTERQDAQATKSDKFTENSDVQAARDRVQKLIWRTELQRNTLQGLILGSGVNWSQDEKLQEMLLSVGKPLDV